ncbi:Nn.00g066240.m01.CDS01 [Neocucurbitaria sp. VM-36]
MAQRFTTQHGSELNPRDTTGLCLLSLDGGGVRGLSILLTMQRLMVRLNTERHELGLPSVKPCEVFDLIGGTSTGGLIAIMLGRLEMDVEECITAYNNLMKTVFKQKSSWRPFGLRGNLKPKFDSEILRSAIEEVLKSKGVSTTDKFNDGKMRGCRTFVCSVAKEITGITRLRSYTLPEEGNIPATICEAALATSAATGMFEPVSIGARQFVDGALGANNPVMQVEREATNIWGHANRELKPLVKCYISIGTGDRGNKPVEDNAFKFLSKSLVRIATNTKETETSFIDRWTDLYSEDRYFRFNVDQGLQDVGVAEYKQQGKMEAATESYLNNPIQKERMRGCVQNLQQKQHKTETLFASNIRELDSHVTRCQTIESAAACCPPTNAYTDVHTRHWIVPLTKNKQFVGRESHLNRLENLLFSEDRSPRIAITGLGGVGKTQIALELAYRTRARHHECSVFWIPATNSESLQQALEDIGQQLGIPGINEKDADIKKLVQRHLSREETGQWLLIVDNIDDVNMWDNELRNHLPKSQRGCVVCTTRSLKVALKIAGASNGASNIIEIPEMDEKMAMQMLSKLLVNQELLANNHDAQKLLERLIFLPLAIVQAAAYINGNRLTLTDYLYLLDEKEDDVIELLSEDFEDEGRYQNVKNPVATTWLISFEQIKNSHPLAAEYLSFMACIDAKDIPQSLLPPGQSRMAQLSAIGTLSAYSFVTRRAADEALDVHRLVHLATRNWLKQLGTKNSLCDWTDKAMARLAEVIPWEDHHENKVWKTYLPHASYVLARTDEEELIGERTELLERFAFCLKFEGRYKEAEVHLFALVENLKRVLGENGRTLHRMRDLASIYRDQGRWNKAEHMYLRILEVQATVSDDNDSFVLITKSELASAFWSQGRWKEAEELEVKVLEIRSRVLGEEHPNTLTSMNNVALIYRNQGRWKDAEQLHAKELGISSRVLGEEHPDTLTSMNNLASTYGDQGRWKEAEELEVKELGICSRVLGKEHPDTLTSMNNLASTYGDQGRWKEAEELEVKELGICSRVLGKEHPDTLMSMNNLALTYGSQGRWKEAKELQVKVLEIRSRVLGEEHPDTLMSMHNLAWTLHEQGRRSSAISLMEKCCHLSEKVLGPQHYRTLKSLEALDRWRLESLDNSEGQDLDRSGIENSDRSEVEDLDSSERDDVDSSELEDADHSEEEDVYISQ